MIFRVETVAAIWAATATAFVTTAPASAGSWAWGCIGKLGNERVIFDRNTMIVTASKLPRVTLRDLANNGPRLQTQDGTTFENLGNNDGFAKTMRFGKNGEPEQKLTLIEAASRKTFHRKGHVGRREEYTTKFLKTCRYAPDKQAERKITMQCIEYVLTTCGGPCS
jgi:hypothetical protein